MTIPDGYEPMADSQVGFGRSCGPFWSRFRLGDPVIGFRVEARHLNPSGVCHGGAIATFADHLALIVEHLAGIHDRTCPTVTLSIDYIAPIREGAWIELHGRLLKRTKTLLFGAGEITADGAIAARVDAIFILGRPRGFDARHAAPSVAATTDTNHDGGHPR